jgi:hypothetical protein
MLAASKPPMQAAEQSDLEDDNKGHERDNGTRDRIRYVAEAEPQYRPKRASVCGDQRNRTAREA